MATSYTAADIATIEAAILEAVVTGIASVSIGGQTVQTYSLKQLRELLEFVEQRIASGRPQNFLKVVQTVPPGAL